MFTFMRKIARVYLSKPVLLAPGTASDWLKKHAAGSTIVLSTSSASHVKEMLGALPGRVLVDPPVEVDALDAMVDRVAPGWLVAIGGGRAIDAAKYLALKSKTKLCVIPPVLSTTSWLNMAIALRKNKVLHFAGSKHANKIIVDPEFISKTPPSLSLGGLADILAACTAIPDWELASERGEKISRHGVAAFKNYIRDVLAHPTRFKGAFTDVIPEIFHVFLDALSLCGAAMSGRPVEGSEHFLYYFLDETSDHPLTHGRVIAATTLACSILHGDRAFVSPRDLREFFDVLGIPYKLDAIGVSPGHMASAITSAREFVAKRDFPYSILNTLDPATLDAAGILSRAGLI